MTAAIATATLESYGVVTPEDSSHVVDRSKIRREKKKEREKLQELSTGCSLRGLYFDGRKDDTLISQESKAGRLRLLKIKEEHISLVGQPEEEYLGHTTPSSGHAQSIAKSITDYIHEKSIVTDQLQVIGCDGTVVNTGAEAGVIRRLEENFQRPLQWMVCLLHCNELPLRRLVEVLDGFTKGPSTLSGPIGTALPDCDKLPVVSFQKIETD